MTVNDNFKHWFEGSKAVDLDGKPRVFYHGTASAGWTVDGQRMHFESRNGMGEGAYFTPIAGIASEYAEMDAEVGDGRPALIPVFLLIKNPKMLHDTIDMQAIDPEQRKAWEEEGHDGMFGFYRGELIEVAVWNPLQIKSAFGNGGAYDPTDPDITDRKAQAAQHARRYLSTLLDDSPKATGPRTAP